MAFELARPVWLLLLGVLPIWWWWVRPKPTWGLLIARGEESGAVAIQRWLSAVIEAAPRLLRAGAIACVILALCHPQFVRMYRERVNEGVGIAFAIDLSTSMRAEDMGEGSGRVTGATIHAGPRTTRLQAAKTTILRFLAKRTDAVGLIAFAGEALTRFPLTRDRYVAESAVSALDVGLLTDGTDIAGAIAAAAGLLRDAPQRSKVLILVTDGAHNKAGLEPARAAAAAAAYGVKIYAIAIGNEKASEEVVGMSSGASTGTSAGTGTSPGAATGMRIRTGAADIETVLTQAARITGGKYFRATDVAALDQIYTEIDEIAPIASAKLTERKDFTPIAPWLLFASLVLLVGGMTLRASRWGVIP